MKVVERIAIRLLAHLGVGVLVLLAAPVLAADMDYPTKQVTIHLPAAPGAAVGVGATIFMEGLPRYYTKPHPFVLNYLPGASGMVCVDYFMKQAADGYNLMLWGPDPTGSMAKDPAVGYTMKDLIFIGSAYYAPFTVTVRPDSPFKTFEEFIDYAKKHPNEMTGSTPGIGSGGHLAIQMLMEKAGIQIIHVPFPGGAPGMVAMLGGHVTFTVQGLGTVGNFLNDGRARTLVVFDSVRDSRFPQIPTAKEKGYDVVRLAVHGFVAKKGTPKPVVDYLVNLYKQIGNDPKVKSNLLKAGFTVGYRDPAEAEQFYMGDVEYARGAFKRLGIK